MTPRYLLPMRLLIRYGFAHFTVVHRTLNMLKGLLTLLVFIVLVGIGLHFLLR